MARTKLPARQSHKTEILAHMQAARADDINWQAGKAFSLVFFAGEDVSAVAKESYNAFFSENGLNPGAFPSLRRMETEVISMTAGLVAGGNPAVVGNMTSGGTESILMTMLTAREWARATLPAISTPEVVLPRSAHPAFDKAAHYFGLKLVHTPVRADFRADVAAMRDVIGPNTVMLVGSAPSYPQGVIDPIAEIAALAAEHNLLCHVDACVGGMFLPFARKLGHPLPDFDLTVPGVTSLSVDLHKYGYTAKGASVILYSDAALRRHQLFAVTDWPGGIYASPAMGGTRPGGAIAAAWAVMNYLGEEGYLRITQTVMDTAAKLRAGVAAIDGVHILSDPDMSVLALASDDLDIYEIADELTLKGWHLDRQHHPPSLHITLHLGHAAPSTSDPGRRSGRSAIDAFLADLTAAVAEVERPNARRSLSAAGQRVVVGILRALPERTAGRLTARVSSLFGSDDLPVRSAPMYGMIGTLPNRGDVRELVLNLVEGFTRE